MKHLVKIFVGIFALSYAAILWIERQNIDTTLRYVKQFTPIPDLNTFEQTRPRVYFGEKKLPHAVLLLHGWSASPEQYQGLTKALQQQGIPYYAPLQTGFGLADLDLLRNIKAADWLRDAINGYDMLAAIANEISIVGISNGAVLATYVAQHRPVKHLVLLSPNLAVSAADRKYKTALNTPVVSQLLQFALPVFNKPVRNNKQHDTVRNFKYPALPIKSLIALWALQDFVDIDKANFEDLTLLYGKQDQDVDMQAVLANLKRLKIPFEKIEYPDAGHNILQSKDRAEAIDDIVDTLFKF